MRDGERRLCGLARRILPTIEGFCGMADLDQRMLAFHTRSF